MHRWESSKAFPFHAVIANSVSFTGSSESDWWLEDLVPQPRTTFLTVPIIMQLSLFLGRTFIRKEGFQQIRPLRHRPSWASYYCWKHNFPWRSRPHLGKDYEHWRRGCVGGFQSCPFQGRIIDVEAIKIWGDLSSTETEWYVFGSSSPCCRNTLSRRCVSAEVICCLMHAPAPCIHSAWIQIPNLAIPKRGKATKCPATAAKILFKPT